jgi:hypothetical protein
MFETIPQQQLFVLKKLSHLLFSCKVRVAIFSSLTIRWLQLMTDLRSAMRASGGEKARISASAPCALLEK